MGRWTATGSRGATDDYYDNVLTGRIGVRNETDCDGAVVVALLVSNPRICVRARAARCVGDGDGGGCARAYVCNIMYVDSLRPNGIRETAACAPAPL